MNIGIFSGSFNPIHQGHLMIANYMLEFSPLEEIWFVVSPHNPLKDFDSLADQSHRFRMVELALEQHKRLKACDFEFHLPIPSYTLDTLTALEKSFPEHQFSLIIGADNWAVFPQWRNHEELIRRYHIYIYERLESPVSIPEEYREQVTLVDSPIIEISSTFIRQSIRDGKDVGTFVPADVWRYIRHNKLYIN